MANLKGGNAVVRILLVHGEKIGMFAIVVCAGMLFWSALGGDRLEDDQQPEKLRQIADRANQHVLNFKWNELDDEDRLLAEPVSGEAMAPVVRKHFPPSRHLWNRPVLDPVSLRTDPLLLAVEDLEVHGDSGLWASADPTIIEKNRLEALNKEAKERLEENQARARIRVDEESSRGGPGGRGGRSSLLDEGRGVDRRATPAARKTGPIVVSARSQAQLAGFEQISAKSWVTVLAKVPIEKQNQLYQQALLNSSGYDLGRDAPTYLGYIVERSEVTDEGEGEWKRTASVNFERLEETIASYPFVPTVLVSSRYTHSLLTHPLPPLILRDWDRRVTHSSIPLIEEDVPEDMFAVEETKASDVPLGEDEIFAPSAEDRQDNRGSGQIRTGVRNPDQGFGVGYGGVERGGGRGRGG